MSGWVTRPSFAGNHDTPSYRVLEKTAQFELREYEPTIWVETDAQTSGSWEQDTSQTQAFYKLFDYISGHNAAADRMPMTVPVRMEHTSSNVNMAFMIPHRVNRVPKPNSPDVKVVQRPRQLVYVRQFGGFSSRKLIGENLESLHIALDRSRRWYNRTRFYTASYNDPYVTSNRHNEVWVEVA